MFLMQNVFLLTQSKWIDMSYSYDRNMSALDMDKFHHTLVYSGPLSRGPYVIAYKLKLNEHSGTHIDAPVHFSEENPTVDELLPENLIGEAIVINVTEQVMKDPEYEVSIEDFQNWEKEHGVISNGTIAFILTGFGKYWGNVTKYLGIRNASKFGDFHFPGIIKILK